MEATSWWDAHTCPDAAGQGRLVLLKRAHGAGAPFGWTTCSRAAAGGHLECLRYAHEAGAPWGAWTCADAAGGGHLECLRYAHEAGAHWSDLTCAFAAKGGHLRCLRYAHTAGAPWAESSICGFAARGGHLECLRYAYEAKAPLDASICGKAKNHPDCLRFVVEAGAYRPTKDHVHVAVVRVLVDVRRRLSAVRLIARAWRAHRLRRRTRAVGVIEAAVLGWLLRPDVGLAFRRVRADWEARRTGA